MTSDKKETVVEINHVDFVGSEEYDIVSSSEVKLTTEPTTNPNPEENDLTKNVTSGATFSSVKQYEEEWNDLYKKQEIDLDMLRQKSIDGQLRTSHFRSVCWRCLLGILHTHPQEWVCQLETYRKHYDEVCEEVEQNPWNFEGSNPFDNPLSQESDSIWQKYFCDEELKSVVQQDVKRTFPGMDFFRKQEIQDMMVRILFCYARQNPALCYRQGMHEILAPLIFILHCDHQAFLHAKEQNVSLDKDICQILNPDNLEQDAFSIFKFVMNHIECSYRINNLVTTSAGHFPADTQKFENKTYQNEVILRLDNIKKTILRPNDPELCDHLEKLDIPLHLFGIRWLRLLFGREFPLQDLLVLWDFIFANNFETVNYIVVAMLIAVRHVLLKGDYTDCLSNLMRYPNGVDVMYILEYAMHLKNPQRYPVPDVTRITCLPNIPKEKSCLQQNIETLDNRRLRKNTSKHPQWFQTKSSQFLLGQSGEGDGTIVCGYTLDDPNILKAELQQKQMVLNIVRHKLLQFHATLAKNLENSTNHEVQVAVDGLYELSRLLKTHCKESSCEIETACEAGETKEQKNPPNSPFHKMSSVEKLNPSQGSINNEIRSHTLPRTKKGPKSGELKVFKHHIGGPMSGAPMTDPLHLIKNIAQDEFFKVF